MLPHGSTIPSVRGDDEESQSACNPREQKGESEAAEALNELPLPGPKKIGRFEIVRVLGRGGQGLMLLAHDPVFARHVASRYRGPKL